MGGVLPRNVSYALYPLYVLTRAVPSFQYV